MRYLLEDMVAADICTKKDVLLLNNAVKTDLESIKAFIFKQIKQNNFVTFDEQMKYNYIPSLFNPFIVYVENDRSFCTTIGH